MTTAVNFRMESDLKKEFAKFCDEIGMSISTAFTVFAKKVVREHRMPFELEADPFYSEENMAELRRRIKAIENGTAKLTPHELVEA